MLLRSYNKLAKEEKKKDFKRNYQKQRKACHKDFWKFSKSVLEDDSDSYVEPAFNRETAHSYFKDTYKGTPATFEKPNWMKSPPQSNIPFDTGPITEDEMLHFLHKSKSTSTPCPADQISYRILKSCPSLAPGLLHLYNCCWETKTVPRAWKTGVITLIAKASAAQDPASPGNFRPIALTSCISKIYTSILKSRWLHYMTSNNYLNTTIQKAFVDGIPGCTEHHIKLLSMIDEARRKHTSLTVCWLDIANAFGSVHHNLILFSLKHYHAPQEFISTVSDLYSNLTGFVRTKSWTTEPFPMQTGVFQGDPLSVAIFQHSYEYTG